MIDKLGKSIDVESWLMSKVDCWGKLIVEESWLMRKVDWWGKFINEKSFMNLGFDNGQMDECAHRQTMLVAKLLLRLRNF